MLRNREISSVDGAAVVGESALPLPLTKADIATMSESIQQPQALQSVMARRMLG